MQELSNILVKGHCKIVDDLGTTLLDKNNAIHPQNVARIIARAFAHEDNAFIHRIAFGNGGTQLDSGFNVIYKTPNDGQSPDISTWDSRIYNETYSEIIDDGLVSLNSLLGTDPGSADVNTGTRSGGGAVPSSDPASVPHVSGPGVRSFELGKIAEVVITSVLNSDEPTGQFPVDANPGTDDTVNDFVFDEIGLYTSGASAVNTSGYQYVYVGTKVSTDDTGLSPATTYSFTIAIDGGSNTAISFTTPVAGGSGVGGEILYGDLCEAINTGSTDWALTGSNPLPAGATLLITDTTGGTFPSLVDSQTYGFLKFTSGTSGPFSAVAILNTSPLFTAGTDLNSGVVALETSVDGTTAGLQNAPTAPTTERERLISHLIFSPVLKAENRTLTITYTLTISVARTPS